MPATMLLQTTNAFSWRKALVKSEGWGRRVAFSHFKLLSFGIMQLSGFEKTWMGNTDESMNGNASLMLFFQLTIFANEEQLGVYVCWLCRLSVLQSHRCSLSVTNSLHRVSTTAHAQIHTFPQIHTLFYFTILSRRSHHRRNVHETLSAATLARRQMGFLCGGPFCWSSPVISPSTW